MGISLKYTMAWIGLVIIAIFNAGLRETGYRRFMSELSAHQLSTLTGILLFTLYLWILAGIWKIQSTELALAIGGVWLVLTISFEFIFGHYIMGHAWSSLLHDYNLLKGRLWVLIPLWTLLAPYVIYRIKQ